MEGKTPKNKKPHVFWFHLSSSTATCRLQLPEVTLLVSGGTQRTEPRPPHGAQPGNVRQGQSCRQHCTVTAGALSVTAHGSCEFISQMIPTQAKRVRLNLKCKINLVKTSLYGIKLHCPPLGLAILL